jgi:hypothetical protein
MQCDSMKPVYWTMTRPWISTLRVFRYLSSHSTLSRSHNCNASNTMAFFKTLNDRNSHCIFSQIRTDQVWLGLILQIHGDVTYGLLVDHLHARARLIRPTWQQNQYLRLFSAFYSSGSTKEVSTLLASRMPGSLHVSQMVWFMVCLQLS